MLTERVFETKRDSTVLVLFFLVATFSIAMQFWIGGRDGGLWDLAVYMRAVEDYTVGASPYQTDVGLPFIYHPFVLKFFYFISKALPLKLFLIIFYLIATAYFLAIFLLFSESAL